MTEYDLSRLEGVATHVGVFEKSPGILIDGAFKGNALVNILGGENVPELTYTIGVGGRGSLVMEGQEFDDLLLSMILIASVRDNNGGVLTAPVAE